MWNKRRSFLGSRSRCLRIEALEPRLTLSAGPISLVPVAALHAIRGQSFVQTVAQFADSDHNMLANEYVVQINWGDGTTTAGQVAVAGNHFIVFGRHTYVRAGTKQVTVAVQDNDGARASDAAYVQTNMVTDPGSGLTASQPADSDLKNPWGIALAPGGPFWVSDNGTGVSTLYGPGGVKQNLRVFIPGPGGTGQGAPTGVVFNGTTAFPLLGGPARFLFATEDGTIAAWNPSLGTTGDVTAVLPVDRSATGAVYKGLAISTTTTAGVSAHFLYAANFHTGRIDIFDTNFNKVNLAGNFTDPNLPPPTSATPGFAPFNVQVIGGRVFVTYALQDSAKHDDVSGPGRGFVDVFTTNGIFLRRLVTRGVLNSPWGLAMAPSTFGAFSNALLVGNFGDGHINAFDPITGKFLGQLQTQNGPLTLDGLWSLTFRTTKTGVPTGNLFFSAGPNGETNGLFGQISLMASSGTVVAVR